MRMILLGACLLVATALAFGGCTAPQQAESFADRGPVWPAPPDAARIRFVTEFSGPGDLGIRPSVWDRLVGLTAGEESKAMVRPMSVVAAKIRPDLSTFSLVIIGIRARNPSKPALRMRFSF